MRSSTGSLFRAETFREFADFIDDVALCDPGRLQYHGGRILNVLSHGQGILSYLEQKPCDLVVFATHGRDGIERWIRGSVSEMVLRRLAIPALVFETWEVNWSPKVIAAFCYTVFAPGLLATILWFWLVRRIGATRAATFHFLNPFFGVAIAAALLGEAMGPLDLVGVAVITFGILAVQISKIRA